MKQHGLTLLELLTSLTVAITILALALPGFDSMIKTSRLQTATNELLGAIENARTLSVMRGKRTVLRAEDANWSNGWFAFVDDNNNGNLDETEVAHAKQGKFERIVIKGNYHVTNLVSFISTGEARGAGSAISGVIMIGKLAVCGISESEGFLITLSKGGRTRVSPITPANCEQAKQGDFNF